MIFWSFDENVTVGVTYHDVYITDKDKNPYYQSIKVIRRATKEEYLEQCRQLGVIDKVNPTALKTANFYEALMD